MNDSAPTQNAKIEQLKKKYGIDEKIAAKYNLTIQQVEILFDPRLVSILLPLLPNNQKEAP